VAYDNGDRAAVYPAGGGHDWIYVSLFGAGTVVLLVAWLWSVPGGFIRRRGRGRRRG
jgi:hypothetical protein